jgi:hypothetical protein
VIEGEVVVGRAVLANEAVAQSPLNRVKAGCVVGLTKDFSDTTLGSWISNEGCAPRGRSAQRY